MNPVPAILMNRTALVLLGVRVTLTSVHFSALRRMIFTIVPEMIGQKYKKEDNGQWAMNTKFEIQSDLNEGHGRCDRIDAEN